MNKKQMMIWVLCLSLFLIPIQAASALAAVPGDGRLTYETFFSGSDSSLKGSSSQQQFFTVMDYWNVDSLKVNLHFQVSQINEDRISSVTLSLNGSPFYSFRPSRENNGEQSLTIPAPKGFLKKGVNTLGIQGYLRTANSDNQVCYVDNTPENWLHLYNTSSVEVAYTPKALTGGISDFSARFSGMDTIKRGNSLLTVTDNASGAELEAATYALSGFAKSNTINDKTLPLLPYSAEAVKDKGLVVLVAMADHLPSPIGEPARFLRRSGHSCLDPTGQQG